MQTLKLKRSNEKAPFAGPCGWRSGQDDGASEFGSRSIAALAEAMDEMTIKEAENEAPEASGNPQSSGGPVVAEPLANQSPALGRGPAENELLDSQSPPQGGGSIGHALLANQAPALNAQNNVNNAGFSNGGRGGYGGEWRGRRRRTWDEGG
uniref:Uncharacterized protein n=1 Tax=Globodera pallida TaxID=36090 RepID=A0A183CA97_GLOPA